MKNSPTVAVALSLTFAAVLVGQLAAPVNARAPRIPGDGGVAGGGTDCATAPAALIGVNSFNTAAATASLAIGSGAGCSTHTIYKVNYFSFTALESGNHSFSTCSSATWDTRIAVNAACGANQVPIACNDDACNYQSTATGVLVANTTYRIVVGGYASADGGVGAVTIAFVGGGGGGGGTVGPDVIVGAIPDVSKYGSAVVAGQTIMAYAIGTTSCNIGDSLLDWFASPDNRHPFIPQNLYRIKSGRVEQIGAGWGKHGFTALQGSLCGACTPSSSGTWLGVGCSDPYSASLNGSQSGLGCRSEVNAATGVFPGTPNAGMPGAAATIGRRIQVNANDLNPTLNVGATYFAEAQYIHPGDATATNDNNNGSWRAFTVGTLASGAYTLALTGATIQQQPAVAAWRAAMPAVTLVNTDIASDGRFTTGYLVTDNGNGTWHYEYAVQNINSHRAARAFSVPVPAGAVITNVGFHDIDYHSGDPYSGTDWTSSVAAGAVTWTGGDYAVSVNGNALRFATLYNFRFDSSTPPTSATATLGLFRPGTGTSATVAVQGPSGAGNPSDLNGDGVINGGDLATLLSAWGTNGVGDINASGIVDGADLAILLTNWS